MNNYWCDELTTEQAVSAMKEASQAYERACKHLEDSGQHVIFVQTIIKLCVRQLTSAIASSSEVFEIPILEIWEKVLADINIELFGRSGFDA